MKKATFALIGAIALLGAACGDPPVSRPAVSENAVFADGGQPGGRSISISITPPQDANFATQALVHRWVANDVNEYRVVLKYFDGSAFIELPSPLSVSVPCKATTKTKAVFINLKAGLKYQASLSAWGNPGGSAPSSLLNSVLPTAIFDFSAPGDVEDTAAATLQVAFDKVDFNGAGTIGIISPADGTYQNPVAPEAGQAQ